MRAVARRTTSSISSKGRKTARVRRASMRSRTTSAVRYIRLCPRGSSVQDIKPAMWVTSSRKRLIASPVVLAPVVLAPVGARNALAPGWAPGGLGGAGGGGGRGLPPRRRALQDALQHVLAQEGGVGLVEGRLGRGGSGELGGADEGQGEQRRPQGPLAEGGRGVPAELVEVAPGDQARQQGQEVEEGAGQQPAGQVQPGGVGGQAAHQGPDSRPAHASSSACPLRSSAA